MRVVFMGTPRCAVPSLEALLEAGHAVPLTVTQPDRPAGRSGRPRPSAVKEAALARGIPIAQPSGVRDRAFLELLACAIPDVIVVVAFGRILPVPVLESAPLGSINVHFSLLPRLRGAAPVQWALARGEPVTGVTTMRMSEGLDEGDVLLQRETAVEADEHAPALEARLAREGAALLIETLDRLEKGALVPRPQDSSAATHAPPLTPEHGRFDPEAPAAETEGRVRGFDPWPGVWCSRRGRRIRIVRARALPGETAEGVPGTILGIRGEEVWVACGGGTVLAVHEIQPEGRRAMSVREALNGRHLSPGDSLLPPSFPGR